MLKTKVLISGGYELAIKILGASVMASRLEQNEIEMREFRKQINGVEKDILAELSRSGLCPKDIFALEKHPPNLVLPVLAPYLVNEKIANGIQSLLLNSFDVNVKESRKYIAELRQCYEGFKDDENKFRVACCFTKLAKKEDFDWLFEYSKEEGSPGTRIEILSILAKFDKERIKPIFEEIAAEGSDTSHLAEYELKKMNRKKRSKPKPKPKSSAESDHFNLSEEPGFSSSIDLENIETFFKRLGKHFEGFTELVPEIMEFVESIEEREADCIAVHFEIQGKRFKLAFLFECEDLESFGISIWGKEIVIERVCEVYHSLMDELGI